MSVDERALAQGVAEELCLATLRVGRPGGAQGVCASGVGGEMEAVGLAGAGRVDDVAAPLLPAVRRARALADDLVVAVAVEVCHLFSPARAAEALHVEG